jgi:L-alanine-DL-glutamate epimerase-like enolase superfamily enzyme
MQQILGRLRPFLETFLDYRYDLVSVRHSTVPMKGTGMKFTRVTPISVAYPELNDNGVTRYLTMCRIEAEDGIVGWGESVMMWPAVCKAVEALIDGYAELTIGADPTDNIALWHAVRDHVTPKPGWSR